MLPYKYIFFRFNKNSTIKTECEYPLIDIKNAVLLHTPEVIIEHYEYPNGAKIKLEKTAKLTVVYTNKPLIQNIDGTFSVNMDVE